MIPEHFQHYVNTLRDLLDLDSNYLGLAVGGSWNDGQLDAYSDIDLVIVHRSVDLSVKERMRLAGEAGNLLAGFTGEHVGEPRLLICLYDEPVLHVDLKFVALDDFHVRVEDPFVVWERDFALTAVLKASVASFPYPDYQWIEDRFWVWVHYAAMKIGRGELFETLTFYAFLQQNVLGPLVLIKNGHLPKGVRKLEMLLPDNDLLAVQSTLGGYDRQGCFKALSNMVDVYTRLREDVMPLTVNRNQRAEARVRSYLVELGTRPPYSTDSV